MSDGPGAARIRAVVVDDAVLLREGLARVLDEAGIDVVGQYADATPSSPRCPRPLRTSS